MKTSQVPNILVVEDDESLALLLGRVLGRNGFAVSFEARGDAAVARILAESPDAVVLDGSLPGKDGLDVCREVRARYAGPILMLTGRSEDMDQVLALELGADDYVAKPAQPRVLLARLRALLRRGGPGAGPQSSPALLRYGRFEISLIDRRVRLADEEIDFTTAEFDLLWLLASRAGTILSRDDIFAALRGIQHDGVDRSIDMRISRLRKRLGDDPVRPQRIKTVRGKGYLFSPTDWD
ncbi:MAG: winged helix-turn-helix domain-containing protein [Betaproteobacteria bacterium]|nr:winged helix-turn-helix domain-containing protein [Betaproteobacteria bacterium]